MSIVVPSVGDQVTATWGASVANQLNVSAIMINGASNVPATSAGIKIQSGTFNAVFSAANNATGTLTYPVAFGATPVIVATALLGVAAGIIVNWTSVSSTAAGWRAETNNAGTTSTTQIVHWIALGL